MLTPKQFVEEIKKLLTYWNTDPEVAHSEYDDLLEQIASENGFDEGIELVRNADIDVWYA